MSKIDFKILSALLQKEEKLLKSRITPDSLESAYKKKLVHIKTHKKEMVGFVALWPTKNKEWSELGTLWVHPDWRKKGIASELFDLCVKNNKSHLFLITRSMKVVHLAETHGWIEEKGDWTENNFWKKTCEPWDSLPQKGTRILPKEGRLFFKKR